MATATETKEKASALLLDVLREMRTRGRSAGRSLGLGRAQQSVLQVLVRSDGIDMKTLAERLEVSQPTATVTVDPLVKKGLVQRQADDRDGRVTRVFLTASARKLAVNLKSAQLEAASRLLGYLSSEERETLARLLEKILREKNQHAAANSKEK